MSESWDPKFEEILRTMLTLPTGEPIRADLDLPTAGVDSLAIVELMLQVEEAYGVSFPDALLTHDTFATPASLWQAVTTLGGVPARTDNAMT